MNSKVRGEATSGVYKHREDGTAGRRDGVEMRGGIVRNLLHARGGGEMLKAPVSLI